MNVHSTDTGTDYVQVRDLEAWLQGCINDIEAECSGAPDHCTETRAYLYGEICALKMLRKTVASWFVSGDTKQADGNDPVEPSKEQR